MHLQTRTLNYQSGFLLGNVVTEKQFKVINENGNKHYFNKEKFIKNNENEGITIEDYSYDSDDEIYKLKTWQKYIPKFGNYKEINAYTFEEEIEEAPKHVWCILHIYKDVCFFSFCC